MYVYITWYTGVPGLQVLLQVVATRAVASLELPAGDVHGAVSLHRALAVHEVQYVGGAAQFAVLLLDTATPLHPPVQRLLHQDHVTHVTRDVEVVGAAVVYRVCNKGRDFMTSF